MTRRVFAVISAVLASACVTKRPPAGEPVPVPASFWRDTGARIGVATVALPKGAVHMVGPQDALDQAIANKKGARLVTFLEAMQPSELVRVAAAFSSRLRAMGFVATEPPQAVFQMSGTFVDLRSPGLLWRVAMGEKQNLVPLEGEWDQPPDYPNLTQAVRRAEREAVAFIESALFAGAP